MRDPWLTAFPLVTPEAELVPTARGLVPKGDGWFVLNARETHWWERKGRGALCEFEGAEIEGATDYGDGWLPG